MVDGTVNFWIDGATRDCPAGSFVFVPCGEAHGFGNPGQRPARILVVTSPGALRLVEEVSGLPKDASGRSYPEDLAAVYARHASEIIGLNPA